MTEPPAYPHYYRQGMHGDADCQGIGLAGKRWPEPSWNRPTGISTITKTGCSGAEGTRHARKSR